ncbi:MAG: ribonuclease HII [Rhodospirillales bacterium]|jgi:ribonuclease HII|nr:ribonuclease HII [Rhodospirillales bacterium]
MTLSDWPQRDRERIAGVDEVGRGPLAGPVMAAAVVIDGARLPAALAARIDDSKRLTARARAEIAAALPSCAAIGVGEATVEEIDCLNILSASLLAMSRAVAALGFVPDLALIDGNRVPVPLPCPARTVIGGDRILLSIAAASIVAKVARDLRMTELAGRYPGYGWERNAGYGTREHREALARLGITPHHRRSFAPVAERLATSGAKL